MHTENQFNPQTHLWSQKQTQRNKSRMKTKVGEDADRSSDTHACTQHRQVNTCWQHIHIYHHSRCIEFFGNKLFIGKSHAHKSNKSTHFLLYTTALKTSVLNILHKEVWMVLKQAVLPEACHYLILARFSTCIKNSAGYPKPTVHLPTQTHCILDSHGATSQGM
jgi:hypothetical protein